MNVQTKLISSVCDYSYLSSPKLSDLIGPHRWWSGSVQILFFLAPTPAPSCPTPPCNEVVKTEMKEETAELPRSFETDFKSEPSASTSSIANQSTECPFTVTVPDAAGCDEEVEMGEEKGEYAIDCLSDCVID